MGADGCSWTFLSHFSEDQRSASEEPARQNCCVFPCRSFRRNHLFGSRAYRLIPDRAHHRTDQPILASFLILALFGS